MKTPEEDRRTRVTARLISARPETKAIARTARTYAQVFGEASNDPTRTGPEREEAHQIHLRFTQLAEDAAALTGALDPVSEKAKRELFG